MDRKRRIDQVMGYIVNLPKRLKAWITNEVLHTKDRALTNWEKIAKRLNGKEPAVKQPKPKMVQLEYKMYQERDMILGFNGKPMRNAFHSWVQEHPDTNWVEFQGRYFVNDHGGTREMLLPETVLRAEKTTSLGINHNGVKVADVSYKGQGMFIEGIFQKDDTSGFLHNVLRLALPSDSTAALELASRYPIVIQIIKVRNAPQQNVQVRHPTKRPLGAWKVFSSKFLNNNIDLFADTWSTAFQGEFLYSNDCTYSAILQTWGEKINSVVTENSTKYIPVNHETIFMICKNGPPISKGSLPKRKRHLFPSWTEGSEPFPGVHNLSKLTFEELCRWFEYYKVNCDLHYDDGEHLDSFYADEPNHEWGMVKLKLLIKDDHAYVVSSEANNKKHLANHKGKQLPLESKYFLVKGESHPYDAVVSDMGAALREIQDTILAYGALGTTPAHINLAWVSANKHTFLDGVLQCMYNADFSPEIVQGPTGRPKEIRMYLNDTPITIRDLDFGVFHKIKHADLVLPNINLYLQHQNALRRAGSQTYMSTYGPRVRQLLQRMKTAPPVMMLRQYDNPCELVDSLDGIKAYPSVLIDMPFIISLHETDTQQIYDDSPLRDETMYVCKVKGELNDEDAILFPCDMNLHFGYHLKHFCDKVDILFMVIPTYVHKYNPWKKPMIDMFQSELPSEMKKTLSVSSIGELGMCQQTTRIDKVSCSLEEAQDFQNRKGGDIWMFGDDFFANRICHKSELTTGFLPVQHWIYCEQRFRLWNKVKELGPQNVVGVKVDEILVRTGLQHGYLSKPDTTEAYRFDPDNFGKLLYQGTKSFFAKPFERKSFAFEIVPFTRRPRVHTSEDESLKSFSNRFKPGTAEIVKGPAFSKRLAILAGHGGAGSGKTSLAVQIIAAHNTENYRVACPEWSLAQDPRFKGKGLTYHALLGVRPNKNNEYEDYAEKGGFDIVLCEEFSKMDVRLRQKLIDHMKRHTSTTFIFTGDKWQLRAIYDKTFPLNPYYRKYHRELFDTFINLAVDDVILLRKSHRQKDAIQRWKDVYSRNRLTPEQLLFKYATHITIDEAIAMDAEYLVFRNSVKNVFNDLKHRWLNTPEYYIGQRLRFNFKDALGKCPKIHKNYILEVKKVQGEMLELYHEPTESTHDILISEARRKFENAFANTCHQRQGETIRKPLVICDFSRDRDWWYVALTRTMDGVPIYWTDVPHSAVLELAVEDRVLAKMIAGLNWVDRKKYKLGNDLTPDNVRELLEDQDYRCWNFNECGKALSITEKRRDVDSLVLDRIVSKLEDCELGVFPLHNIDNVRPSCASCNCSKKDVFIL